MYVYIFKALIIGKAGVYWSCSGQFTSWSMRAMISGKQSNK